MAVSFASLKGQVKKPFKVHNLFVDGGRPAGGTPTYPPIGINPTEPPTNTAEGGLYFDDDNHALYQYNGSTWEEIGTGVANNATFGGTVDVTGLFSAPRKIYATATTLTATDSGALCVFNAAAGFTYTLPAAAAGLHFEFFVQTTITSSNARIACASGDFFNGTFIQSTDGTYTSAAHVANGSTHLAWEGNGSTTGGLQGDWLRCTAVDGTTWYVYGMGRATGSEATPWKTS